MTVGRVALAATAAIAAALGVLAGYSFAPDRGPLPAETPRAGTGSPTVSVVADAVVQRRGPSQAEYRALERELEAERKRRAALEIELALLRDAATRTEAPVAEATPPNGGSAQFIPSLPGAVAAHPAAPPQPKEWFNRDALVDAGLSSSEIREIEERWEAHEMQKLYLTDKATREGTHQTREFYRELAEMNRGVREDLGPEGYDAFLFATGKPNRVVLKKVLESSPAGYAGLEAGDIVIRYAGDRVFHGVDFKAATNQGEAGIATSLEVQRGGRTLQFSVPRGPLGVQLAPRVSPPEKNL